MREYLDLMQRILDQGVEQREGTQLAAFVQKGSQRRRMDVVIAGGHHVTP